jgi:hypothetical protein
VKEECFSKVILLGECSLRRALSTGSSAVLIFWPYGDDRDRRTLLEIEDRQSSTGLDLELAILDGDLKIGTERPIAGWCPRAARRQATATPPRAAMNLRRRTSITSLELGTHA